MRERSLYEVLEYICRDIRSEYKTPGELATMLKPWLTNLTERIAWPDEAPLLLRSLGDAPGWNRFNYSEPGMRQVSGAHYLLRAAESLEKLEDLESCLFLIGHSKAIMLEALNSWRRVE